MKEQTENPLIPMGALTGRPSREQIRRILAKYREAGIEQYLIYPRSGCELEYLSEEYLDTVDAICEEAEKLGFTSIWLYDEFNWPSGSCAHRVPHENPDFAARFLCAYRTPEGIKVEVRSNPDYTDLMNPAAADRFIALTHERYYKRLKPWFGKLIKGIFTDEPEIGYFRPAAAEPRPIFVMGWYDGLEDEYRAETGSSLRDDLAVGLHADPEFFPIRCAALLGRRFRTSYIDRVRRWCDAHGVALTGHLMDEYLPLGARRANGRILPALSGFTLPGIDDVHCHTDMAAFEFLTYSTGLYAIEQRGNRGGLAELFATCRCDTGFVKLVQMVYLAAAFGIDHYVLAVAATDPRGNAIKKEFFHSFAWDLPELAAWPEWAASARRAARLARKERLYEVGVRYGDNTQGLPALLRDLAAQQLNWRLLDADEEAPEELRWVFTTGAAGVLEEKSGVANANLPMLLRRFREKLILSSQVCYDDGVPVQDILVRRYKDGSILVIDMAGRTRRLKLRRNGGEIGFELSAYGVMEFPGWRVEFEHPHVQRLEFDADGKFIVELTRRQALKLALRSYGGTAEVAINGKAIAAEQECTGLPESFRALYREAELGTLPAGKYTFTLCSAVEDYGFLPAALLLGNDLPAYAGRVVQSAELVLPADARKIRLVGSVPPPGDAMLLLNGNLLGCRLREPYEWVIPDALRGTEVEVRMEYSSSISALFGRPWRGGDALSSALRGLFAPDYRVGPAILEIAVE